VYQSQSIVVHLSCSNFSSEYREEPQRDVAGDEDMRCILFLPVHAHKTKQVSLYLTLIMFSCLVMILSKGGTGLVSFTMDISLAYDKQLFEPGLNGYLRTSVVCLIQRVQPPLQSYMLSGRILFIILLRSGDVHPNPGPGSCSNSRNDDHDLQSNIEQPECNDRLNQLIDVSDQLNILNWNVRGINDRLTALPAFLSSHDIQVAVLTETRRSINKHKSQRPLSQQGYTFHFSSYKDPSYSTSCISPTTCQWGVCIAIRDGLAYQTIEVISDTFAARILHGSLIVPTKGDSSITIEIIAVYALAKAQEKGPFWEELTTYVTKTLKRIGNNDNHHLCLVGD
jgi:hypothetical protein